MTVETALKNTASLKGQERIDALRNINTESSKQVTFKQKLPAYFALGSILFLIFMLLL